MCVCVPKPKSSPYELRTEDNKWFFFSISHKWLITKDRGKTCLIFSRYTHTQTPVQAEWWIVPARVINMCQFEYWTCQSVFLLSSSTTTTTATTSCSLCVALPLYLVCQPVPKGLCRRQIAVYVLACIRKRKKHECNIKEDGKENKEICFRKRNTKRDFVFNFCLCMGV